jgi:predicted NBD/HSP70 family sugar kinase
VLNGAVTGSLVRELNLQAVYLAMRQIHPVTRAQLARHLGTSKPTTSRAIDALLAAGLIDEVPRPEGVAGYSSVYFGPRANAAAVLGVDVGTRYVRGVLADLDGAELARVGLPTSGVDVVATTVRLRDQLVARSGVRPDLVTVGIGAVIDPATGLLHHANQPELDGFAAAAELRAALGVPVAVENDINLAAIGEGRYGEAVGVHDFAFLSVGSGVGAGLVLSGQLRRGRHGAAGEIDIVPVGSRFNPLSPAADAFLAHVEDRSDFTSCEEVFAAARENDPLALDLVGWEAERIAEHAARITQVVDVALIVLGGGLGLNGDLLVEPVNAALANLTAYPPRVAVSRLGETAILTGAVATGLLTVLSDLVTTRVAATG